MPRKNGQTYCHAGSTGFLADRAFGFLALSVLKTPSSDYRHPCIFIKQLSEVVGLDLRILDGTRNLLRHLTGSPEAGTTGSATAGTTGSATAGTTGSATADGVIIGILRRLAVGHFGFIRQAFGRLKSSIEHILTGLLKTKLPEFRLVSISGLNNERVVKGYLVARFPPFRTKIVGVCREDQSSGKTCVRTRSDLFLQCSALCDLLQYMFLSCKGRFANGRDLTRTKRQAWGFGVSFTKASPVLAYRYQACRM
ncbi:hypothetical protein OUZ56_029964 [Daphnia magna]|uniref:Uncharacterized protein n=1 Tax=Daphnia magna TaxID=35525 RepID=A0ABR0B8E8_9CRUS|nr:hypothetical protein OUZ56_029964 [Daphnia magna]